MYFGWARTFLPPKEIFSPEPQFSGFAGGIGIQGTLTLGLIVDDLGFRGIYEILSPLGAGLDEQAVLQLRPGNSDLPKKTVNLCR